MIEDDDKILEQMGLTGYELTDLLNKTNEFFKSLNPAQRAVFLSSQQSRKEAAATLRHDVSPDELERFLRKHGDLCDLSIRWCKVCKDDDDETAAEEE